MNKEIPFNSSLFIGTVYNALHDNGYAISQFEKRLVVVDFSAKDYIVTFYDFPRNIEEALEFEFIQDFGSSGPTVRRLKREYIENYEKETKDQN